MDTKKLRQKILDLAIRGKLVPQDPNDEPASLLLERIRAEKERLIKEGKIKRSKETAENDKREAPFEIPESWVWTNIEAIAESNIGLTYKPSDITLNGIPVYRSNNIQNKEIDLTDIVRVKTDIQTKQYLSEGDLLICARNGSRNLVGKCALIKHLTEPTSFGAFMAVCRSEYNEWIYLLLNSEYFNTYLDESNSTAINQVTQKMLLAFQLPFPPKKEQKRIYNEVTKLFSVIDELESNEGDLLKAIDKAKSKILDLAIHGKLVPQDPNDEPAIELLKRINPKFNSCDGEDDVPEGWEVASFKTICDTISSKPYQILQSEIKDSGKFPVISQSANYIEGYSDREECVLQVKKPVLIFGDHTRVLKYVDFDFIVGADGVKIIQTKLTPKYVYYVLLCTIHKIQGKGYARHFSILSNTLIPVPPREEQLRIVSKIEEVFKALDALS